MPCYNNPELNMSRLVPRLGIGIRLLLVAAATSVVLLIHVRNRITGCP